MTRYPGVGGIETVTSLIVERLIKTHSVTILSHLNQESASCFRKNIRLLYMPNSKDWCAKENVTYAKTVVESTNFNVIIYQDSYAPTEKIVCGLSHKYAIPLIVFEHNSPLYFFRKQELFSWLTMKGCLRHIVHSYLLYLEIKRKRLLLQYASKYVLLSQRFIPEFCDLLGNISDCKKVIAINNPIRENAGCDIKDKENILLYVGRLVPEKRVDKMLLIWKKLQRSNLTNGWRFFIVGDGPERKKIEKIIRTSHLDSVSLVGYANPQMYYKRAKIFLMMSKYEGWGMTLCEAMQQGVVPIVIDTFSSVHDIISNNQNGILVQDEKAVSQSISRLMTDSNLLERLSFNAMNDSKRFLLDNIIPHWESLLKETCK